MKVSTLKKNPGNPRQIKGERLELLKKSVAGFQKMMALRPMIVDENNIVIGGNMRLAAIKALGLKEIPDEWVKFAKDLTPDERAQFIITDNSSFGEYDWDEIANSWTDYPLSDWGLSVPDFDSTSVVPDDADWMSAFEGDQPIGTLETVNLTFVIPLGSADRIKEALAKFGTNKNVALVAMAEKCLN